MVGNSLEPDRLDAQLGVPSARKLARRSYTKSVPIVLDLSAFASWEREKFLFNFLAEVWNLAKTLRYPYLLFLEEAHNFIPQNGKTDVSQLLVDIAAEGRKRGLGIIMINVPRGLIRMC